MKGLAVTILLAILEIGAITTSGGDSLLSGGSQTVPAIRRKEADVRVDAKRPHFTHGHRLSFSKSQEGRPA